MADFGLAAQIGRGGGVAGPAPVDPSNRMMQLLQMQQLQQNMMLARQQEAREAALAPLRLQNLQQDIRGTGARADVATTQAEMLRAERDEQQRKMRVNRGMIDVLDMADKGKLDLSTPEGFNSIKDPEVRMAARAQISQVREIMDKAQKAGLEARGVQRAAAYDFLDRAVDGIDNAQRYQAATKKLFDVSPEARDFVPDYYNPRSVELLRDFVRTKKTSIQMINGVPVMVTEGDPVARELGIAPFNQPAAAPPAVGGLTSVPPGAVAAPDVATRIAAGTPVDVGAMPSGIPGQRLPAAGEPGFVSFVPAGSAAAMPPPAAAPAAAAPAAAAPAGATQARGAMPASQFVSERQAAPKPLTIQQERKLRNDIADDFKSATSTIDQMQGVLSAAREVVNLPASVKDSITGWSGYVPSFREDTRSGDVALNNLKGKVTQLGRQAASLSGAIGSMAVQEWKIVSDMIASLDEKGMNPRDLDRQMALIEAQAQGTMNRIRDAYQRQYAEEFERFGDRFKLPEPRQAGAAAATSGPPAVGAIDSGYRFKGGDPSKPSSWEKI